MTPRRAVALLVVALAVYFVMIGSRAVTLLNDPQIALKVFGASIFAFPVVGIWVVFVELRFGFATERLGQRLDAEGVPNVEPDLARLPSGRVDRAAADAYFEQQRAIVEADPDNWRGWYQLAMAYDFAGDRRRARAAMRTAIQQAE